MPVGHAVTALLKSSAELLSAQFQSISCVCLSLPSWHELKQEVRALHTEPAAYSTNIFFHPWSFHLKMTLSSRCKTRRRRGFERWIDRRTNVGCLPANTVESNQAKQICKADPGSLKGKGCKQRKCAQIESWFIDWNYLIFIITVIYFTLTYLIFMLTMTKSIGH